MKTNLKIVLVLTFAFLGCQPSFGQRWVGHVSSWNSQANLNSVLWANLTDVYYSSINPSPEGTLIKTTTGNSLFDFNMSFFNTIKTIARVDHPTKRIWIVLGGPDASGQRSSRLNTVCSSSASRATLVNELISFVSSNQLNGIVIDWEFPTSAAEKLNHQRLITDLRTAIQAQGNVIKLAAMVGGEYKFSINHLQLINQAAIDQLDYVDVLAFDLPSTYNVDHSATIDAENSLNAWAGNNSLGIAVPKYKLSMGIAAYGCNASRTDVRQFKDEPNYNIAYDGSSGLASGYYYNSESKLEAKVTWGMANGYGGFVEYDILNDRPTDAPKNFQNVIFLTKVANPLGANFTNAVYMGDFTIANHNSYMDRTSNATTRNYKNDYGQPSDDVFYQFRLLETSMVTVSLCNDLDPNFDTYMYLLDANKNVIALNDDNGPLCHTLKSSIAQQLAPGTYYIIVEGYGSSSGFYEMDVAMHYPGIPAGANFVNPIVKDSLSSGTTYTTPPLYNNPVFLYGNDYGQSSDDIVYLIKLKEESRLTISTCDSDFDTYIHVLTSTGPSLELGYNDDNGPICSSTRASLTMGLLNNEVEDVSRGMFKDFLLAGDYFVVFEGYGSNSGKIQATFTVQSKQSLINQGMVRKESEEGTTIDETVTAVTLAPNPASQEVVLTLPSEQSADLEILNASGIVVKKLSTRGFKNTIELTDLHAGLYFIQIKQGSQVLRQKLEVIK